MTVNINEATDGDLTFIATDLISGTEYPQYKAGFGGTGVYTAVQNSEPLPVKLIPYTSGGLSRTHLKAAASTNSTSVKASAGQVYKIHAFNGSGGTKYLKLYDKATAPTVGTDTPVGVYPLQAGAQTTIDWGGHGMPFTLGIGLGITGGVADSDTTAVTANDVILNMGYK